MKTATAVNYAVALAPAATATNAATTDFTLLPKATFLETTLTTTLRAVTLIVKMALNTFLQ